MRTLLDREMPVEKERDRKPLIIWWRWTVSAAAAVLLPAALLTAWWLATPAPAYQEPVADRQTIQAEPSAHTAADLPHQKPEHVADGKQEPNEQNALPAIDQRIVGETKRPLAKNSNDVVRPDGASRQPVTAPHRSDAAALPAGDLAGQVVVSSGAPAEPAGQADPGVATASEATAVNAQTASEAASSAPSPTTEDSKATDAAASAPSADAPSAEPASAGNLPAAVSASALMPASTLSSGAAPALFIIEPAGQDAWSWGVSTGLVANDNLQAGGAAIGLTTDWDLSEKWGIRAGLNYRYDQPGAESRPLSAVSEASFAEATREFGILQDNTVTADPNSTPNSVGQDASQTVLVPVTRLHRLELPLALRWEPLKRVRMFGGGVLSRLAYAQAAPTALTNTRMVLNTPADYQSDLNRAVTQTLPRWQFDWQLGAGVRVGKRFEINAFYRSTLWEAGSTGASSDSSASLETLFNGGGVQPNSLRSGGGSKLPGTITIGGVVLF